MGVINGSFGYNCATDQTVVTINTGPGTPKFVQHLNFKLNGVKHTDVAPNSTVTLNFAGKITAFNLTRIEFVWTDSKGTHYANHADVPLTNNGTVVSCEVPTTTTTPATTTTVPAATTTTVPVNISVCDINPGLCLTEDSTTTTVVVVPAGPRNPQGGNGGTLPATGGEVGIMLFVAGLCFLSGKALKRAGRSQAER